MKVTHVIDSGGYYGAEVMLVHLCQAQQQTGMDVEVISIGTPGNYKKPLEEKLEEHGIRYIPWRMRALPDLRESFRILKHCKQGGSDVIHSHGYKGNILLGLIPRRLRKIPVITTVHGYTRQSRFSKMTIYQWLDKLCLPRLDAVVIVSEGMRHQVPEKKLGSKLHVVANGIPTIDKDIASKTSSWPEGDYIRIVSAGRLSKEKNFSFLINKAKILIDSNVAVQVHIYGDGPQRRSLEELIKALNLEENVVLKGYTNDVQEIYQGSDLYVNCSVTEGMPVTLLEAMRTGIYVIASNIPANKEILGDIEKGILLFELEGNNFENLVKKFRENSLISQKLREKFISNHTSEKMSFKYKKLYETFKQQAIQ